MSLAEERVRKKLQKSYAHRESKTITKCMIFLALRNHHQLKGLLEITGKAEISKTVREILDTPGFYAILALGCEEC